MKADIPTLSKQQQAAVPQNTGGDWRDEMVERAQRSAAQLATRERHRNPLIPDNFLDVSNAGFPADMDVRGVQIPRQGNPAEMMQYRSMLDLQWQHVPWHYISLNGGADGKANIPGAVPHDLGGGNLVAALGGNYLMFADRKQYENRRARNLQQANRSIDSKQHLEEKVDGGARIFSTGEASSGPKTIEELLDYDKRLGEEPAIKGKRLGDTTQQKGT